MKILFTADLHLNIPARCRRAGSTVFEAFAECIEAETPDTVVVAGDIGNPAQSVRHLVEIRNVVGDRRLAIALGNHDFWLETMEHAQYTSLDQIMTRFWLEPSLDVGAIRLAFDALEIECSQLEQKL